MPSREQIELAKERVLIPTLWRILNLPGNPKACCRSPFRKDKHPSFSIYDSGRRAKDHASGELYDAPKLLAEARGLSIGQALKEFVAIAGLDAGSYETLSPLKQSGSERQSEPVCKKPDLSKFRIPSNAEIRSIARDRGLNPAAPEIARRLGCLKVGDVCGYHSWILTDPAAWNAEARRFGRLSYPAYGELSERKAHTLKHRSKSWPVGLGVDRALVEKAALIVIVEGTPDLLAAWHFIHRAKRWDVLPITVLGRCVHGLHCEAMELLKGKTIKFFPHADPDDGALKQIEFIGEQLRKVGCRLSYFDLAGLCTVGGKDLNDLASLEAIQLGDLFYARPT
jgi:hypothetical protein